MGKYIDDTPANKVHYLDNAPNAPITDDMEEICDVFDLEQIIDEKTGENISYEECDLDKGNIGWFLKYDADNNPLMWVRNYHHYSNDLLIDALKKNLSDTDYVLAKIMEGLATREDYADTFEKRAEWRSLINELQENGD